MTQTPRLTIANVAWLVAYLATMAMLVFSLMNLRENTVPRLDTPEGRAQWEAWRARARAQAEGDGPVRRRVPKSSEPPTVILLRDHFPMCLSVVVLFGSMLFLVTMFLVRGMLRSDSGIVLADEEDGPPG